jgi:hypothetical protein
VTFEVTAPRRQFVVESSFWSGGGGFEGRRGRVEVMLGGREERRGRDVKVPASGCRVVVLRGRWWLETGDSNGGRWEREVRPRFLKSRPLLVVSSYLGGREDKRWWW